MTTEDITAALKNWIPYKLFREEDTACCRWLYTGEEKFTEPFFDDTIATCRKFLYNSKMTRCVSSMEILPEWADSMDAVPPTAFIFHVSRCGSTLVSQLLGLNPANIILSEVPFFDELLRWGHNNKEMKTILPWLGAAVKLYGTKREDVNQRLFIKTDSWHIHFYKQLRELYPTTPFILLYRRPDEVIRSQQKRRGMQAVPGVIEPSVFGFDTNKITTTKLDEYMAAVIETYLTAFIDILKSDRLSFPVNYNEGAIAIVKKIAAITGISLSEQEIAVMKQRSVFHAKYPEQVFEEPSIKDTPPAYMQKVFELYDEAEAIRISRGNA